MSTGGLAFPSQFPGPNHDPDSDTSNSRVCSHPVFFSGQCTRCGRKTDGDAALVPFHDSAIPLRYISEDLRLSRDELARVKAEDTKRVLGERKLYLVLDLDQTLLHTFRIRNMDPDKVPDLLHRVDNTLRGELFHVASFGMLTRLRPFVRTFLEEANALFEMYIFTRGQRAYAHEMARLLDPEGVYFGSRILAKEDCTTPSEKGLDGVLGQESAVLIVDDQARVWPDHQENLILVEKYDYFSHTDIDEDDGELALVLEVLKAIHINFFSELDPTKLLKRDVRKVMEEECES